LKPFGRDRLERAIKRASSASSTPAGPLVDRAKEALQPARKTLSRIFVRDGPRIVPIVLASIERIQGADDYATVFTSTREYLVSIRLTDLEGHLADDSFLRIHRSHVINLDYVTSIEPWDATRLQVRMKSGVQIVASRAGSKRLRELAY
jgi:two-component system, LytTR family, response regulator